MAEAYNHMGYLRGLQAAQEKRASESRAQYQAKTQARSTRKSSAQVSTPWASITDQDWAGGGRGGTDGSNTSNATNQNSSAINDLIGRLESQSQAARAANLARYDQALGIYGEIEKMYQPGGQFETSAYGQLNKMKEQDLAHSMQTAVDSGMSKTTGTQYASQRWTDEVGAPAIQKIQAQAQGLLAQAMGQRAGFIERREDVGPDYGTIAQLAMAANS